jgi:hypothetical protein
VNEAPPTRRRERLALALSFVLFSCIALGVVGRHLEVPGLYYDEVIQAEPAVQFLADDGRPSRIPGARTIRLFGGWFPVMVQPYMGAVKSHALMPAFAAFGATAASLRLTTLTWSLVGLLFAMLWAREVLGTRVALVAAALLAVDPSFLWTSRHDWGSFALGFLCRCGGLYFVTTGWTHRTTWRLFAGGLCLGLGVYNKIDFGVLVVAAGLALAIALPRVVSEAVRSRGLRPLPAALGFLLGAGPMIAAAGAVLAATHNVVRRQAEGSGDWVEKVHALVAMLDGSYFHKLMLAGGSFEGMFEAPGASTGLFLVAFLACGVALGAQLWRDRRRGELDPAQAFVWLATLAVALGLFLTPRTVRIHHTLNLYPFPQLVVAIVLVRLWEEAPGGAPARRLRRAVASAALCAVLAGSVHVNFRTLEPLVRRPRRLRRGAGIAAGRGGRQSRLGLRRSAALRRTRPRTRRADLGDATGPPFGARVDVRGNAPSRLPRLRRRPRGLRFRAQIPRDGAQHGTRQREHPAPPGSRGRSGLPLGALRAAAPTHVPGGVRGSHAMTAISPRLAVGRRANQPSSRFAKRTTIVFTPARSNLMRSFCPGPDPTTARIVPRPKIGW